MSEKTGPVAKADRKLFLKAHAFFSSLMGNRDDLHETMADDIHKFIRKHTRNCSLGTVERRQHVICSALFAFIANAEPDEVATYSEGGLMLTILYGAGMAEGIDLVEK